MRKRFTMTKEQRGGLLDACQPVPYMIVGGLAPRSPQENAESAWCVLGREMGFDGMTVQPDGSDQLNFTAEAVEQTTSAQRHAEPSREAGFLFSG